MKGMMYLLINQANQLRSGWLIGLAFIFMYVGQAVFMIPALAIAGLGDSLGGNLITQGSGTLGGIIATLFVWKHINKDNFYNLGFRGTFGSLIFGLALGAISITVIFIVLLFTKNINLINSFSEPNFNLAIFGYLIMFILVGIFEEIFFRGYVIKTMLSRNNKTWVIYVVSALFFSLVHGINPNISALGLFNIMLVGLLFAYMFLKTKSLYIPIGYHITWNYFQGNVFGFSVSGIKTESIYVVDATVGNDLFTGGTFGLEGGFLATGILIIGFLITKKYVETNSDATID